MPAAINEYIEIRNLANPELVFKRLEGEFIDIMEPDRFYENSVIMWLDKGIDPDNKEDILWLKELLDTVLPQIGETGYFLVPYHQ